MAQKPKRKRTQFSKKSLNSNSKTCYNKTKKRRLPTYADSITGSQYEVFWQNLTITDDFIFGKIMLDRELCMELLRRIFPQYDIERIEYVKVQETIRLDKEAKGTEDDIAPPLKEFLDYVAGREQESPSEFIIKLKVALHHAKQNREWRRQRMILYFRDQDIRTSALQEGHQAGLAEGLQQGRQAGLAEGRREMILSMVANGVDRQIVLASAGITEEELETICPHNITITTV